MDLDSNKRKVLDKAAHGINLLKELYNGHSITIGDQTFETANGVIQGGLNSPWMFSVYIEHFIYNNPLLK